MKSETDRIAELESRVEELTDALDWAMFGVQALMQTIPKPPDRKEHYDRIEKFVGQALDKSLKRQGLK